MVYLEAEDYSNLSLFLHEREGTMPKNFIQDLAGKIQESLPEGVKNVQGEAERFIKEGVDNALSNFKFVRYEEFEIQQKILLKTREKLEHLTKRVEELEAKLSTLQAGNEPMSTPESQIAFESSEQK